MPIHSVAPRVSPLCATVSSAVGKGLLLFPFRLGASLRPGPGRHAPSPYPPVGERDPESFAPGGGEGRVRGNQNQPPCYHALDAVTHCPEDGMTPTDLCYTQATKLIPLIRSKKLSPVELMRAVLERIEK